MCKRNTNEGFKGFNSSYSKKIPDKKSYYYVLYIIEALYLSTFVWPFSF